MVSIDAKFDQKQLEKLLKTLGKAPKECRKGAVSAINRSVKTTNTALQKAITRRYNIKKNALSGGTTFKGDASNNLIKPKLASESNLSAQIMVRGSRLALVSARGMITPTAPRSHKGKTMRQIKRIPPPSVRIIKGSKKRYPHAFVATGRGGVTGIFSRGKYWRDITLQRTLSPANMAREKSVAKATQKAASESLEKNVAREIKYRLEKIT